jgi:UDP-glucose:(heptosyl)LPS alpha-1,3-glucosyltransferase
VKRLALASRRVEGLSGAVRLILAEAEAAVRDGWEVHVFAERLDDDAVRAAGAVPRRVPRWPWGSWLKRRAFAAAAGRMTGGFDLVHGHGDLLRQDLLSLHNCVHAAREAATGGPLPASDAVGRLHALQLSEGRFRLVAANSRLMKADLERRFGVPPELIEVVYPGFDARRFAVADRERLGPPLRAELGVPEDALLFGLVTSGDFEKRGLPDFLRAFARVAREEPRARALVVGKEARPGRYRRLAAELGVEDRVSFRPPLGEVERFYHALDAYVHAARWEEFGMTVLEAMACGVPAVVSAGTGAAELAAGPARELVLPEPSPEALAAAMLRLAREPALRAALAAEGPGLAAPHTLDAHGRRVAALYERLRKK